jgi:hypothetical protein
MKFTCPHCNSLAVIRTSRKITHVFYEYYCSCKNKKCGFRFRAVSEIVQELKPSAVANCLIQLPIGKKVSAHSKPKPKKEPDYSYDGVPRRW